MLDKDKELARRMLAFEHGDAVDDQLEHAFRNLVPPRDLIEGERLEPGDIGRLASYLRQLAERDGIEVTLNWIADPQRHGIDDIVAAIFCERIA